MYWRLLAVTILLAGCSTKYQDMGFAGGVSAQQMTSDTFRIVARGNGYTDSTTVRDYAMLKAAETAKQHGASHFVLVGANDSSRVDQIMTPGTAQTTVTGSTAFTTYNPAQSIPIFKPGQDIYIRLVTVKQNESPPAGAISADEIVKYVGGRIERG
jgi:hypothetical protein